MPENSLAPLAAVLGIRTGSKVSLINPPPGFVQRLNPLPVGVEFLISSRTGLDVIMFFTKRAEDLVARLPALSRAMAVTGGIWICWKEEKPKILSEDFIRQAALEIGLIDNKKCQIDEAWSALRLIWKPRGRIEKPRPRKSSPAAQA